jgi:CheY-like chemotaxis protein
MAEILIGEDNPADVYLIRIALQEHAIDLPLRVAADGQELLRIIDEEERVGQTQTTLIILDINLPRHDGLEILKRLRRSGPLSGVPVAVLTSSDSPRDRLASADLGAARFLQKPSSLEQFLKLGGVFKELLAERQPANLT